jgi:2-polyprenyl-3-methyl-5-hydroxy-6-metoxy-1,4-benzoquinol methylase
MRELPPALQALADAIVAQNPVHAQFLHSSIDGMNEDALGSLLEYVNYCTRRGQTIGYLADCYNTIVNDTLTEQFYFWKNDRYRYSKYSEVAEKVYLDASYMNKYMYGLALTAFLWPNHAQMYEFFKRTFPLDKRGAYLEIGPGHGYYIRKAAELGDFDRLVGVDISPTSVAMTRDILAHSGLATRAEIRIIESNFLESREEDLTYACIVMGEVLEHVEEPAHFLTSIAERSDAGTHVFITTCVNAPAVDHIFLFRKTSDVDGLIQSCGFDIVDALNVPITGKTLEQCEKQSLPINVAYVLRKR